MMAGSLFTPRLIERFDNGVVETSVRCPECMEESVVFRSGSRALASRAAVSEWNAPARKPELQERSFR